VTGTGATPAAGLIVGVWTAGGLKVPDEPGAPADTGDSDDSCAGRTGLEAPGSPSVPKDPKDKPATMSGLGPGDWSENVLSASSAATPLR
jgi:hypothetical protein